MGGASSTQRGSKSTQSQTVLRESTNANASKDIAQPANIAKHNLTSLNLEQDHKKDDATSTERTGDTVTAILSQTNSATKVPDQPASILLPSVNNAPGIRFPQSTNAISPPETLPPPQLVASQPIKDGPTPTLGPDQGRRVLGRINGDLKTGTQVEKKTRKGRGRRKGKVTEAAQGTENVPPAANQQNTLSRRRRARGSGYGDIGTRPATRRSRAPSGVGGVGTTNVVNYVASQSIEAVMEDVKTTGRHSHVDRAWEHGRSGSDANIRPKHRGRRQLPTQGVNRKKSVPAGLGIVPAEDVEIPKTALSAYNLNSDSDEDHRRSAVTALSPCGETKLPDPTTEGDGSTLHPLPSSTRRRAKEYFQRRTRERSVDTVATRHSRPPHRHVTMPVLRPQLDLKCSSVGNAPENSVANGGSRDQFVFDPEASPFTPNATSSPRQTSVSSIGVQSFSSPTPLPSHGNRKVVPLVLPETSNGSNRLETKHDSRIPVTSHGITHGLAYTYAEANQAQAHIQAEQIALMRLQAYYNWLAGTSIPTTAVVGIGIHDGEHMEMSGGGGGLSGGVALGGRHAQIQGRGKGQGRNSNGAYAHPKEHVIFSPRDHERTEVGPQSALQKGIVQSGKGVGEKEAEGEIRRKWDGKWGLREVGATGKEVGWSWGRKGTKVELGPRESPGE